MSINQIGRDPAQLEAFYREHIEAVQRFITRRISDPYLVADLASETFLAAIDAAESYSPARGTPRAWLFGIARNVVNSELRQQGRAGRAATRLEGRRHLQDDALERAAERLDAERETRALFVRLSTLPESQRAVVELVSVDGLSITDAAAALGISASAARVRLHRARHILMPHIPITLQEQS